MLGSQLGKPTRYCLKKETCCCRFVSDKSLPILITEERHDGFAFWNISDLSSMNVSGPPFVTIFWKKIGVVLSNDLMKITNGKKKKCYNCINISRVFGYMYTSGYLLCVQHWYSVVKIIVVLGNSSLLSCFLYRFGVSPQLPLRISVQWSWLENFFGLCLHHSQIHCYCSVCWLKNIWMYSISENPQITNSCILFKNTSCHRQEWSLLSSRTLLMVVHFLLPSFVSHHLGM